MSTERQSKKKISVKPVYSVRLRLEIKEPFKADPEAHALRGNQHKQ